MKQPNAAALEIQVLLPLVATIQGLHTSGELEPGRTIALKCPCGRIILPPILVQASIKDRQRGLLKAKVESHLRDHHGVSKYATGNVLKDGFSTI